MKYGNRLFGMESEVRWGPSWVQCGFWGLLGGPGGLDCNDWPYNRHELEKMDRLRLACRFRDGHVQRLLIVLL